VHRQRAEVDAIAIGSGTLLSDDPLLTARGAYRARPLTRVVFDRRLRTPASARLMTTIDRGPVIIVSTASACDAAPDHVKALEAAGARVLVPADEDLAGSIRALVPLGVTSVVMEGGPALHRAALAADIVDAVHVYITPRQMGADGVDWIGAGRLAWEALHDRRAIWLDEDVLVEGYVHGHH
jgi:diaminohydroxyphosphoribosylaminopyrimidine deaminase/5-amino-6-(5-phosphoribosylamino)uracil reductase